MSFEFETQTGTERAKGSGHFGQQFGILFIKQWLVTMARWGSTLAVFLLTVGVQFLGAYAWSSLVESLQVGVSEVEPVNAAPVSMMIIVFWGCYVLRVSSDLCTEKRERIREGLRMMG